MADALQSALVYLPFISPMLGIALSAFARGRATAWIEGAALLLGGAGGFWILFDHQDWALAAAFSGVALFGFGAAGLWSKLALRAHSFAVILWLTLAVFYIAWVLAMAFVVSTLGCC
ncbi:MAG: hypothetical protein ABUS48_07550 [Pseudomonadota bacterium]